MTIISCHSGLIPCNYSSIPCCYKIETAGVTIASQIYPIGK